MHICSRDTFLRLKIVKNGELREWGFKLCLRHRRHFFRRTKLGDWRVFKKIFLKFWSSRCHRKMCGLFPCIPILKVLFFIKWYYGIGCLSFCVKLIHWLAAKHTPNITFLGWKTKSHIFYCLKGKFVRMNLLFEIFFVFVCFFAGR